MAHAFRFFRHMLKRMACVIVPSMFGTAMAASSCGNQAATQPGHTDQIASPAGHGYNAVNGCSPELCREMLVTCATASGMAAAVPPVQNSPLPDAVAAPQRLSASWLPAQHVPVVAVPLPLSFPLYLRTSRLLI